MRRTCAVPLPLQVRKLPFAYHTLMATMWEDAQEGRPRQAIGVVVPVLHSVAKQAGAEVPKRLT